MKFYLFLFGFLAFQINFAQLIFEENFDYPEGNLTNVFGSSWIESPSGSVPIKTTPSGNLSYINYESSGKGRAIYIDGGATGRSGVHCSFTSISNNSIYISALIQFYDNLQLNSYSSNGDNFMNLENSSCSDKGAYLYVKLSPATGKVRIGLAKASVYSLEYIDFDIDMCKTYLVIISYTFIEGNNNDIIKLWLNPNLSGDEPSPNLQISSGADLDNIGYIQFRQREYSGNIFVDGIRVATSWDQAPLPVELTSFTGAYINNAIQLEWETATEVNNYGFEIQRSLVIGHQSLGIDPNRGESIPSRDEVIPSGGEGWEDIGFVQGNGNSNSVHTYSFIDNHFQNGNKYKYRLKQIDNDGSFSYSTIVEIEIPLNNKFYLFQNYPNPFNSQTRITWYQPEDGEVILRIYDNRGSLVKEINLGSKTIGINHTSINADDISSGCYFLVLKVNSIIQTKKIILIK